MKLFFPPFPQTLEIDNADFHIPTPRRPRGSISLKTTALRDTHSEGKVRSKNRRSKCCVFLVISTIIWLTSKKKNIVTIYILKFRDFFGQLQIAFNPMGIPFAQFSILPLDGF